MPLRQLDGAGGKGKGRDKGKGKGTTTARRVHSVAGAIDDGSIEADIVEAFTAEVAEAAPLPTRWRSQQYTQRLRGAPREGSPAAVTPRAKGTGRNRRKGGMGL